MKHFPRCSCSTWSLSCCFLLWLWFLTSCKHVHTVDAFTASTRRTVPKKAQADEEDEDEDFGDDDSFIDDDSEDVGDDSDYAPPVSDDSGKEDIKGLQKEAKAFLKRRKWTRSPFLLLLLVLKPFYVQRHTSLMRLNHLALQQLRPPQIYVQVGMSPKHTEDVVWIQFDWILPGWLYCFSLL